jgi:hypothetical protein
MRNKGKSLSKKNCRHISYVAAAYWQSAQRGGREGETKLENIFDISYAVIHKRYGNL